MPIICTHIKIRYRWCMWLPEYAVIQHQSPQRQKLSPLLLQLAVLLPWLQEEVQKLSGPTHQGGHINTICSDEALLHTVCSEKPWVSAQLYLWSICNVLHLESSQSFTFIQELMLRKSCITHHCILSWANQNFWNKKGKISSVLRTPSAFYCKYYPKPAFWTYFPGIIRHLMAYIYSWNQQSFHFYCSSL